MRTPIPCAISGPASMTMLATPVSSPIANTAASWIRMRFHQGRVSVTLYAMFSVLMSAPNTAEPDQSARTAPIEMIPGAFFEKTTSLMHAAHEIDRFAGDDRGELIHQPRERLLLVAE